MTDLTGPLVELRAAYRAYQNAKRNKKEEITEKYAARIADEVRAAVEAEKYAFAKHLAETKELYSLRVTDIQDHVLRTRNWKVWEDIRDYADIQPEQIVRENAKAERDAEKASFVWDLEAGILTVKKDRNGKALEPILTFHTSTLRFRDNQWMMVADDDDLFMEHMRDTDRLYSFIATEVTRAIDAGELDTPE